MAEPTTFLAKFFPFERTDGCVLYIRDDAEIQCLERCSQGAFMVWLAILVFGMKGCLRHGIDPGSKTVALHLPVVYRDLAADRMDDLLGELEEAGFVSIDRGLDTVIARRDDLFAFGSGPAARSAKGVNRA